MYVRVCVRDSGLMHVLVCGTGVMYMCDTVDYICVSDSGLCGVTV